MSKASDERRAAKRKAIGPIPIDISARGARASQDVPLYFNAAMEQLQQQDFLRAEQLFRKVISLLPDRPAAPLVRAKIWHNLGICLLGQVNYTLALEALEKAHRYDPEFGMTRDGMLFPKIYSDRVSAKDLFAEHVAAGERLESVVKPPTSYPNSPDPARKLRVGFCSGDFRRHPVMQFFEPVLQNYDRTRFEVFLYAEVVKPDSETVRLRRLPDAWRATVGVSDEDMAAMVAADGIDILIDLAGHTSHSRPGVFARKPAPVQMTWLGYPHSTGLTRIDWRIVDALTDPPGAEAYATEKLYRLPLGFSCYQPQADAPPISPPPCAKGGPIVFGSFNIYHKVSASTLRVWAKLMAAVPNSRLLVKSLGLDQPRNVQALLDIAMAEGVDVERFDILRPTITPAEHLACYEQVDIGLDPFPYNGTTSTFEALWMGVPVVTLAGNRHAGRVGATILHQVGLDELVAQDRDTYVAVAAKLAADREALAQLRATLRERLTGSVACDAKGFAKRFDAMLADVWSMWCRGQVQASMDPGLKAGASWS